MCRLLVRFQHGVPARITRKRKARTWTRRCGARQEGISMSIDKSTAFKLWDSLRENLLATEETLKQIIEYRAWEPLGYAALHEAWAVRMGVVLLSGGMEGTCIFVRVGSSVAASAAAS